MALILAVVWSSLVVRLAVSAFLASLCIVENRHQFRRTWLCDEHLIQSHQDESSLPLMFYISFMFHEIWEIILYTQANTILILILMQNDYQKLLQYKKALIFCQQMIDILYPSSFWHLHGSGLWRGRQSTLFSGDTEVFQSQPRPFQHVLGLPSGPPPGYMKDLTWETPQSGTRTTLACFSCGPVTHRRV